METLIIRTKSKSNAKLLFELSKKIGDQVVILPPEQAEDFALGLLMDKIKTGETVSRKDIMKELSE
ncbi:MAG: hypothetical protein H8D45_31070 [Bacteroidetes bacterium]|nr:hypothetical protein [Bacteroidota bacterium]MBL7105965.1 hypothetical protein [Bacteroidales bacterium]